MSQLCPLCGKTATRSGRTGGCPSCPRSRPSAASSSRRSKGGGSSGSRCSTSAGRARCAPPSSAPRCRAGRSRGWGGAASTCCSALDGAQTLVMHLRMTGNLVLVEGESTIDPSEGMRLYEGERSTSERHLRARFELDDGRELWFTDPRRFGEAFLIDDAGLEQRFERLGVEPLSDDFTAARCSASGRRRPHGAAEVVPARPVAGRRGRQHLRRRGAVPGPPPPALAGRLDAARAPRGAARRGRRGARGRPRARRRLDRRLPRRARRAGLDAERVPRPHPRGRGLPELRRADLPDRRLRPLDLLLPELPGAPAQTAAPSAVRPAVQR